MTSGGMGTVVVGIISALLGGSSLAGIRALLKDRADRPQRKDAAYLKGADQAVLTMGKVLDAADQRANELQERTEELEARLDKTLEKVAELSHKLDEALARVAKAEQQRDKALHDRDKAVHEVALYRVQGVTIVAHNQQAAEQAAEGETRQ